MPIPIDVNSAEGKVDGSSAAAAAATASDLEPELREAERFMKLLGDGYDDWTFQTLDDDKERGDPHLIRLFQSRHGRVAPDLVKLNRRGAGVFAMVNRGDGLGRRTENVVAVRAVFVDLDGTPLSVVDDAALEPHLVVESSPRRYHAYWCVEDLRLEMFERVQKILALQLQGDPSVSDLPRLMRLPGFYHQKTAPFRSRIIRWDPMQPYVAADLLREFRIPQNATKPLLTPVRLTTGDIREGGRNKHLASLAGSMRRRAMTRAAIEAALMVENKERCSPPLKEEEVARIAQSISGYSPGDATPPVGTSVAITVRASDIQPEPVEWLWPGRLPLGKVSIIAGDPGLGKSLLTTTLAFHVTIGARWPLDSGICPRGDVILLSAEDDMSDTIRPRLDAAGADPERVRLLTAVRKLDPHTGDVTQRMFSLKDDLAAMDVLLGRFRECRLVVVDPISAYLDGTDSHKNADVRGLLAPLAELAARHKVAIVCVTHLNKGSGGNAIYRATGSLAFVAAARSYLLVARDPEDESRRLLLHGKSNLGRECQGMAFTVTEAENGAAILVWDPEPVTITADEALSPKGRDGNPSKRDEAAEWLQQVLSDGPIAFREIERLAKSAGLSMRTVQRAKQTLDVESYREGFGPGSKYVWQLPCMPKNAMRASHPRAARMGTYGDRIQPELALGINGLHGGWAVACRRFLVKAWKFLRSALKSA